MTHLLVIQAISFAEHAHRRRSLTGAAQLRKYTDDPYIIHPLAVMKLCAAAGIDNSVVLAAAALHDTVEDTTVTLEEIEDCFGVDVRRLVFFLTDISKPEDGNRAIRKAIDRAHNSQGDSAAQSIKVADMIVNGTSIIQFDKDFARVYMRETRLLLDALTLAAVPLRHVAAQMLELYEREHVNA